jgi:hypothetical protein
MSARPMPGFMHLARRTPQAGLCPQTADREHRLGDRNGDQLGDRREYGITKKPRRSGAISKPMGSGLPVSADSTIISPLAIIRSIVPIPIPVAIPVRRVVIPVAPVAPARCIGRRGSKSEGESDGESRGYQNRRYFHGSSLILSRYIYAKGRSTIDSETTQSRSANSISQLSAVGAVPCRDQRTGTTKMPCRPR